MRFIGTSGFDARRKRVVARVDFNVPLEDGRVVDSSRIEATLPTIRFLQEQGARVALMSHLGRPKGRPDPAQSLAPVAARLGELLGEPVRQLPDCVGAGVEAAVAALAPGEVVLLENLRFHPGEEANDPEFARQLAALGELYVNDAFGAAHRAHASVEAVTRLLPSYAGFLLKREVDVLSRVLERPEPPLVVVLGGAKVSDKIGVVDNFLERADAVLLGGGMAFTFLKARGLEIGWSLLDAEHLQAAAATLRRTEATGRTLELPTDVLISREAKQAIDVRQVAVDAIPPDMVGVDIGERTARAFGDRIRTARTVVWNGPMGVYEVDRFAEGTRVVARAVQQMGQGDGFAVVGGGDSVAAVNELGCADGIDHLSTGGGASLEFLEGKLLPGVAALS